MNWDRVQGYWQQVTGKAREQWGKLIDNDLDIVAGRRDQLMGKSESATEQPRTTLNGRPPRGNTRRAMLDTMAIVLIVLSLLGLAT